MSDIAEVSIGRIYSRIAPQDCAGLTINDASTYGGWGRSTTYTLINSGRIKAIKVRGRTIALRASADDYLKSLAAS
jgi:excisionase family DNA binding protein